MKPEIFRFSRSGLTSLALVATLIGCSSENPPQPFPSSSSSTPSPNSVQEPTAKATEPVNEQKKTDSQGGSPSPTLSTPVGQPVGKIAEIPTQSVLVRQVGSAKEIPAKERMDIQVGDTIRTQNGGKVQIEMNNGLAFRVGSDASVTIGPDNRLNFTSGEMITWVAPGKKVPTQIVTTAGVAGIRGTTVYVDIPKNSDQGTLFFAWEGKVTVQLPGQQSELMLINGQEVTIKPGEKNFSKIRSAIKPPSVDTWGKRSQCLRQPNLSECSQQPRIQLFRNFKQPLPTLSLIEKALATKQSQPEVKKQQPNSTPQKSKVRQQE